MIGLSWDQFWCMNPKIYKLHVMAYNEKMKREIKQQDAMLWSAIGNYVLSAVTVAVEKCLAGNKAKASYVKEPLLAHYGENDGLTEEEIAEKEMLKAIANEEKWIIASKHKGLPETIIN